MSDRERQAWDFMHQAQDRWAKSDRPLPIWCLRGADVDVFLRMAFFAGFEAGRQFEQLNQRTTETTPTNPNPGTAE